MVSLIKNQVIGCCFVVHKVFYINLSFLLGFPLFYHDHLIALVAASMGSICYIQDPLLLYRRHGNNLSAVRQYISDYLLRSIVLFLSCLLYFISASKIMSRLVFLSCSMVILISISNLSFLPYFVSDLNPVYSGVSLHIRDNSQSADAKSLQFSF